MAETSKVNWRSIITVEPEKCSGKPCIRGMRIRVSDVLNLLAAEMTFSEILDDYPDLTREDIVACLTYSAEKIDLVAHGQ